MITVDYSDLSIGIQEVNDEFINSIYERESVLCESFEKDDFKPQDDFWNLQTQPIVNNWSSN